MLLYKDFKILGSVKKLYKESEKNHVEEVHITSTPSIIELKKSSKLTSVFAWFEVFCNILFYQKLHTYLNQIACNTNADKNPNLKFKKWQNCLS